MKQSLMTFKSIKVLRQTSHYFRYSILSLGDGRSGEGGAGGEAGAVGAGVAGKLV